MKKDHWRLWTSLALSILLVAIFLYVMAIYWENIAKYVGAVIVGGALLALPVIGVILVMAFIYNKIK